MQLSYPWFLLGLLALAAPIIIHLLQLRRPQRVMFTNTAIIKQVELVTTRYRRVQELLVLLARVLTIFALVIVFCQPFIPAREIKGTIGGIDAVIDNSFSMQLLGNENSSLLGEAVGEAQQLGEAMGGGNRLRLLNAGTAMLSKDAYDDKLEMLRPAAKHVLNEVGASLALDTNGSTVFIFSDFQKNAFSSKALADFGLSKKVVLVPLKGQSVGNIYVDSVWVEDAFMRVRTNVGLHVRLRNGGLVVATDCPVKVFLGSRQVAAFRVTVEPGQAVASVVQVQLLDKQLALGRVVTEDAPVVFDNTYYFTLQPAAAIWVVEIGEEPAARQVYGNEPLFTYRFSKAQSVDYTAMRQANLVLVHELETVDAGLRDGLRAVVKRGGSVVVVPSAAATAHASYQQLFRDLGLGTVQWEAVAVTPELREVAMPGAQEPFFRDVFGAQSRTVTMPQVAPVLRWSRTGTDILRLRDGESYLADFASGAGRVYVFSAPFARAYSNFTAQALFVPVMYRMAMLSYKNEQMPSYRLTQAAVSLQLAGGANGAGERADAAAFRLVRDSLMLIPGQRIVGQEVRLEIPAGMDAPGFYQVQRQGKVITTLAFNQDKRESELAAYSADELRQLVGPNRPNVRVVEGGEAGAGLAKFRAEQTGVPLWRYFLALALVALLAEVLLVRFGRRRVAAATLKPIS